MTAPTPERRVGEELTAAQKMTLAVALSRVERTEPLVFALVELMTDRGEKLEAEVSALHAEIDDCHRRMNQQTAEVERLTGIELKYRKSLWMGHGHDHLYGDDGEMQCTQCPGEAWDYRRAPLDVIERAAWLARVASLPTPGANGAPPEATE